MRAVVVAVLCVAVSVICLAQTAPDKLALAVKDASRSDGLVIVEPVTPVLMGVAIDSGNRALANGDVLTCTLKSRMVEVTKDGAKAKISTILFDCGKTKLEFKQLGAAPPEPEE